MEALDRLGFKDYKQDAEAVLNDCKAVAAKRRRQSTRLENLGIPEEELLRQQQELFAKARQEQAAAYQAQWMNFQQNADAIKQQPMTMPSQQPSSMHCNNDDADDSDDNDDDY